MQLPVKYRGITSLLFEQMKEFVCAKVFFSSHHEGRNFKSFSDLLMDSANAAPSWPEIKFHNFGLLLAFLSFVTELSAAA